ncbi:hypothetical protein VKT23_018662 [Stygiomarasmius scandens]|uniref:Uncharacterized protein n=1 Tax=Marasmiellus scandens TaxID=2682957 RepID=A0ABR1ISG0_9AGAR
MPSSKKKTVSKAKPDKPTKRTSKSKQRVDSDRSDHSSGSDSEDPSTDAEDIETVGKKRPKAMLITSQLKAVKKPRVTGLQRMLGLDGFKRMARWLATSHSPSISWINVFAAGLERDEIIEKGSLGVVPEDEEERKELLYLYDTLREALPQFDEDIQRVLEDESFNLLISRMNESSSDAVTQDVRKLKDAILPWLPDVLKRDLDPPIEPDTDKEKTRGFYHPDIGRLLCTPIKLPIYDKDPKKFCRQARENELEDGPITGSHFPAVFYGDLGEQASAGEDFVFFDLLYGWLLILTWVHIFLGRGNAAKFRQKMAGLNDVNGDSSMFKVHSNCKAYRYGLTSVTYRTIAYASFILRHTLSATDDRRIEEGGVVKLHAFNAVVALFENKQFMNEEWIEQVLSDWQMQVNWMLPNKKQPELMDEDDQNSSLNQIARILEKRRKAKAAATDPSSDAPVASDNGDASGSASPPPSTSSTPESEPSAGAAESPQLSQQPLKTVTNTISTPSTSTSDVSQPSLSSSAITVEPSAATNVWTLLQWRLNLLSHLPLLSLTLL